jgi:hypothetical protein
MKTDDLIGILEQKGWECLSRFGGYYEYKKGIFEINFFDSGNKPIIDVFEGEERIIESSQNINIVDGVLIFITEPVKVPL